jgi:hypothetical protein
MDLERDITGEISRFAETISYDDLPSKVIEETKRLILDSIGCAIGGVITEKGEIGIRFGEELSQVGDTTILGHGKNAHPYSSAFANGELMNALDYESLLSPPEHLTPYVMPACITSGEMKNVSGKELILSIAIAHEITTRISESLVFGNRFRVNLPEKGITLTLPTPGYGMCLFGGIAGAGKLMGFTAEEIANAMGIGGFSCPIPQSLVTPVTGVSWIVSMVFSDFLVVRPGCRKRWLRDWVKNGDFRTEFFTKLTPVVALCRMCLGFLMKLSLPMTSTPRISKRWSWLLTPLVTCRPGKTRT